VYTATHTGPLASVRVILSLARARLRSDREVDHWLCAMLRVRTRRRRVVVSNDGELVELSTPLEYAVVPEGVRVLVPGATPGGPPA
jgi:diacylglycerol kinase family enzyme